MQRAKQGASMFMLGRVEGLALAPDDKVAWAQPSPWPLWPRNPSRTRDCLPRGKPSL